jgi:hypothetical protein
VFRIEQERPAGRKNVPRVSFEEVERGTFHPTSAVAFPDDIGPSIGRSAAACCIRGKKLPPAARSFKHGATPIAIIGSIVLRNCPPCIRAWMAREGEQP